MARSAGELAAVSPSPPAHPKGARQHGAAVPQSGGTAEAAGKVADCRSVPWARVDIMLYPQVSPGSPSTVPVKLRLQFHSVSNLKRCGKSSLDLPSNQCLLARL